MNGMLDQMRDIVQEDVGQRGLRTMERNLISETAGDFRAACHSITSAKGVLAIVTGFYIPSANPPAGETDGPLGAVFLARALVPLGIRVAIVSDQFCVTALKAGLSACGLQEQVTLVSLAASAVAAQMGTDAYCLPLHKLGATHLLAIERVGPSYTLTALLKPHLDRVPQEWRQAWQGSAALLCLDPTTAIAVRKFVAEVPEEHRDRCHTMRGRDITEEMSPAHLLFEAARSQQLVTIGIGDGGNEIGMGKIPWEVIDANIPRGGLVACRVPTDHLIVAGVSNWGAYALAAGVYALRGVVPDPRLFDPDAEWRILDVMVKEGPLVDGVLAKPSVTVDGLSWEQYSAVLPRLRDLCTPRRLEDSPAGLG